MVGSVAGSVRRLLSARSVEGGGVTCMKASLLGRQGSVTWLFSLAMTFTPRGVETTTRQSCVTVVQ